MGLVYSFNPLGGPVNVSVTPEPTPSPEPAQKTCDLTNSILTFSYEGIDPDNGFGIATFHVDGGTPVNFGTSVLVYPTQLDTTNLGFSAIPFSLIGTGGRTGTISLNSNAQTVTIDIDGISYEYYIGDGDQFTTTGNALYATGRTCNMTTNHHCESSGTPSNFSFTLRQCEALEGFTCYCHYNDGVGNKDAGQVFITGTDDLGQTYNFFTSYFNKDDISLSYDHEGNIIGVGVSVTSPGVDSRHADLCIYLSQSCANIGVWANGRNIWFSYGCDTEEMGGNGESEPIIGVSEGDGPIKNRIAWNISTNDCCECFPQPKLPSYSELFFPDRIEDETNIPVVPWMSSVKCCVYGMGESDDQNDDNQYEVLVLLTEQSRSGPGVGATTIPENVLWYGICVRDGSGISGSAEYTKKISYQLSNVSYRLKWRSVFTPEAHSFYSGKKAYYDLGGLYNPGGEFVLEEDDADADELPYNVELKVRHIVYDYYPNSAEVFQFPEGSNLSDPGYRISGYRVHIGICPYRLVENGPIGYLWFCYATEPLSGNSHPTTEENLERIMLPVAFAEGENHSLLGINVENLSVGTIFWHNDNPPYFVTELRYSAGVVPPSED